MDEKRRWDDLNDPDYRAFKDNPGKLARPASGTLQWLVLDQQSEMPSSPDSLQKEDFVAWRDSSKPGTLLVTGPPGQGKSVLSNFLVDHLHQFVRQSGSKVIYYFCNIKNDESLRTASAVLRALIVQLCEDARLFRMLPNRFQDRTERPSFHSAHQDELWRTFEDLVKRAPYDWIYCIIDGLDVYKTGMEDLLTRLKAFTSDAGCRLKLLCTSRPTGPVKTISLSPRRSLRTPRKDLEKFVDEQLGTFTEMETIGRGKIREAVLRKSGRTFLWISIVLRTLRNIPFPSMELIEKAIEDTPPELNELYNNLLKGALEHGSLVVAILVWVAYAKRPLTIQELETAATVTLYDSVTNWTECCKKKEAPQ